MKKHIALINVVPGGYEIQGVHEVVFNGSKGTTMKWVPNKVLGPIHDKSVPYNTQRQMARYSVTFEDLIPVSVSKFCPNNLGSQTSGGSWRITAEALREVKVFLFPALGLI